LPDDPPTIAQTRRRTSVEPMLWWDHGCVAVAMASPALLEWWSEF